MKIKNQFIVLILTGALFLNSNGCIFFCKPKQVESFTSKIFNKKTSGFSLIGISTIAVMYFLAKSFRNKNNENLDDNNIDVLEEKLRVACQSGDIKIARKILDKNPQLANTTKKQDKNDIAGWGEMIHPIAIACKHGREEIVDLLLQKGANPNVCENCQLFQSPLHFVCQRSLHPKKRLNIVKKLLARGMQKDEQDAYGKTALHYACSRRLCEVVVYLAEQGFDLNKKDKFSKAPIDAIMSPYQFPKEYKEKLLKIAKKPN